MTAADLLQLQIADKLLDFAGEWDKLPTSEEIGELANRRAQEIMALCGIKEPRKIYQMQTLL